MVIHIEELEYFVYIRIRILWRIFRRYRNAKEQKISKGKSFHKSLKRLHQNFDTPSCKGWLLLSKGLSEILQMKRVYIDTERRQLA